MSHQFKRRDDIYHCVDYRFESNPELLDGYSEAQQWLLKRPPTVNPDGQLLLQPLTDLHAMREAAGQPWPETVDQNARYLAAKGFWPGRDFVVIPYKTRNKNSKGEPVTAEQNAASAQRNGALGVELWAIAKSFAGKATLSSGETETVILTGPGDLEFKMSDVLRGQVGELEPLSDDELNSLGFVPGTVSPLKALGAVESGWRVPSKPGDPIYLFDRDFLDKQTRNRAKKVYISGGDKGWSIAIDMPKLLVACHGLIGADLIVTSDICQRGPDQERIFPRHDVKLYSGDSAQVGNHYYGVLEATVRSALAEADSYFVDDMPRLNLNSAPEMGGTGDLSLHEGEIVDFLIRSLRAIPKTGERHLVGFTSNAANSPSFVGKLTTALQDRPDIQIKATDEALESYIKRKEPGRVIVFGLPDVVDRYPDRIGQTLVVKGKGKIAEWMQAARGKNITEVLASADELKKLIAQTAKTQMARQQGVEDKDMKAFMQDQSIVITGTVLLAGTELWEILASRGWQEQIDGLEGIELINPVALAMDHLGKLSLTAQA